MILGKLSAIYPRSHFYPDDKKRPNYCTVQLEIRMLDVTYENADVEIIPRGLLGSGIPAHAVRLKLSNFAPLVLMLASFVMYFYLLVPIVFPAMKPQSEAAVVRCKMMRAHHNIALFVYSGLCFSATAFYLFQTGELFDRHAFLCTPVEGTWLRLVSITFTLSKIWEWLDTAFLVWLGSQPPSFLHKYHHATTFWLFCFSTNMPASEKLGMLINGGVHAMMVGFHHVSLVMHLFHLLHSHSLSLSCFPV